ncbi:MAG TPA: type IV pilin N-terminal domain-containing protein [Candidatus Thermoplasmatota archaeon]|nr:type IV pilin N-terminal domain-containing protein [Candidatus Thermoplasmatota archaeon]
MKTVFGTKNKKAVSPVIGTILMVAITVVLAAVLYVMVSGIGTNPNTNNPSTVLQAQNWNAGNLLVNVQSSSGATVNPTDLTFIIQDRNGTTYYTGVAGLNTLTSGTNVNITYQDNIDPSKVGAGDSVKITVTPTSSTAIQGGRIRLFYQSNEIGAVALP